MKSILQQSRLGHVIQYRNGYLLLALCSLVLNGLLVLALFRLVGHERIVIVPPQIEKSFWVSGNQVSPEYLSEMSLFFANLRLNMTASNAASQREILLRHVSSNHYSELKSELVKEMESLKKRHITTAFFPVDVKVDPKKLISRITGDLQSTIGDMHIPSQRVTYQVAFSYDSGRLQVKSFEEVKKYG